MGVASARNSIDDAQKPLRVLLDARKFFGGGIGTYLQRISEGLAARADVDLTLLVTKDIARSVSLRKLPWFSHVRLLEGESGLYSVDEYLRLGRSIDAREYDVFHAPHYTLPFGLKLPSVVTVHDILHVTHPEKRYYPWVAKPLIRSALKRSDAVVTVSRESRRLLAGVSSKDISAKVSVIPNSIDPFFLEHSPDSRLYEEGHELPEDFFLAVLSNRKPHKGLETLLNAWKKVSGDTKLVLVGEAFAEPAIQQQFEEFRADGVLCLGRVSKELLRSLYHKARALVVPSLAEGFFIPVIEAKMCGLSVVARPAAAVLENLENTDFVANSFSEEDFVVAIEEAKMHASRKAPLDEWQKRFELENSVDQLCAVYRDAISRFRAKEVS